MTINIHEAEQFINNNIAVTRQMVVIAKHYAANHPTGDSSTLINAFLKDMHAETPKPVVVHPSVDSEPNLKMAAESISWQIAMCEAIWGLVHANVFVPVDNGVRFLEFSVEYSTIVERSGGERGGWTFSKYAMGVPNKFRKVLSLGSSQEEPLSDGDLYIHEIGIPSIHPEVEEALRDAVECFRHELYTPALAMLAKASEGAWLELGAALLKALPDAAKVSSSKTDKELNNPWVSVAKKIQTVLDLYNHSGLQPVREKSGIDEKDIKQGLVWSEVVRESRNVVHYGVQAPTANTYEKLAALLLGAVPHLRIVYQVYDAAMTISKENAAIGI